MSGTTAGTTSGTVLGYSYPQRKVLDHAFRKAGRQPEAISSEWIVLAQEILFAQLSEYIAVGFPLWTRQELLLPIKIGSVDSPCPYGTVDVIQAYWRRFNPYRSSATDNTGTISLTTLIAGAPNNDISIAGPNPGIAINFGQVGTINTIGVLPGYTTGWLLDGNGNPILDGAYNPILGSPSSYSASLEVLISQDGVTWINAYTLPETTFQAGVWSYFDLAPTVSAPFIQLVMIGTAPWTLNQVMFGLPNSNQWQIGLQNIDDYYNLPNRFYRSGQVNTVFVDRKRDSPVVKIWPTPNQNAFYNGTLVALCRRYIQDPGAMTNSLEIPARWIEAVTSRLGLRLMDELPSEGMGGPPNILTLQEMAQRRTNLEASATKAEFIAWSEEKPSGNIRITPAISAYTK